MEPVYCPKCGAVQDPAQGELSLTCGSLLAELSFGPDVTALEEQSERCRLGELQRAVKALPVERQEALLEALDDTGLEAALRAAIVNSGLTAYAVGKRAGLAPDMISRFVSGERGMRLRTAGKIAEVLGLELKQS